jgi:hypothetical protein
MFAKPVPTMDVGGLGASCSTALYEFEERENAVSKQTHDSNGYSVDAIRNWGIMRMIVV